MIQSVITERRNAALIAAAAELWIKDDDLVLDVTYGRGKFWEVFRPQHLVTHDVAIDGIDFRWLPEADESFDVIVFDPPYVAMGGRDTSTVPDMQARYGMYAAPKTPRALNGLIIHGLFELYRVLKPGGRLFVKCMDYISSGKFVSGHAEVVAHCTDMGMIQVDEFVHHSGTGPQPLTNPDGSPRRQVHSRRAHSFLCIFKRPVR